MRSGVPKSIRFHMSNILIGVLVWYHWYAFSWMDLFHAWQCITERWLKTTRKSRDKSGQMIVEYWYIVMLFPRNMQIWHECRIRWAGKRDTRRPFTTVSSVYSVLSALVWTFANDWIWSVVKSCLYVFGKKWGIFKSQGSMFWIGSSCHVQLMPNLYMSYVIFTADVQVYSICQPALLIINQIYMYSVRVW